MRARPPSMRVNCCKRNCCKKIVARLSRLMSDEEYEIEAGGELLMHSYETLPDNCKKYWKKRYQLFHKFDEGIYMTSELWYSVTPELMAIFTATLIAELMPDARNVLDICCGGGGNTIQFANFFETVGAIDINALNEQCTRHNAAVYGVEEKIWSHIGDWNEMCKPVKGKVCQDWIPENLRKSADTNHIFDFIFASPPWGGPAYTKTGEDFDVINMEPFGLDRFIKQLLQYTENIGLFLPKSSNLDQLRQVTSDNFGDGLCRIIYLYHDDYCSGMLALFGTALTDPNFTCD